LPFDVGYNKAVPSLSACPGWYDAQEPLLKLMPLALPIAPERP
jgi:hypothetical protein